MSDTTPGIHRTDALAVVARGVLGAIPVCGSLMAEVVGVIIPNQRVDRIARLVELLGQKVADLEQEAVAERLKTPEGVDLLEDGFHQASRALSDERLEYIANVLRAGITEEQAKVADKKRLMWLLGQLDDAEIILLTWHSMLWDRDEAFEERHGRLLQPADYHCDMSEAEADIASIRISRMKHLHSLGLMEENDRASTEDITPLGCLLVRVATGGKHGNW